MPEKQEGVGVSAAALTLVSVGGRRRVRRVSGCARGCLAAWLGGKGQRIDVDVYQHAQLQHKRHNFELQQE
jgi:hypothetical protein